MRSSSQSARFVGLLLFSLLSLFLPPMMSPVHADPNHDPAFDPSALCTTTCYVDPSGDDNNDGNPGDPFATIQKGIDVVQAGGTVVVNAGTYTESLNVNKSLTLDGAGVNVVTIDASTFNDYSIDVTADDVTLEGFMLIGFTPSPPPSPPSDNAAFGIKVSGVNNFTAQDLEVQNTYRTGLDLNSVDGALIDGVTVTGTDYGNGMALTDSNNITVQNSTTNNNVFGGLAIYPNATDPSDTITIAGSNNFGETNPVYVQVSDASTSPGATNLDVQGYEYIVRNDTFRPDGPEFTFFQKTLSNAVAFALGLSTPDDSYINKVTDGEFWVGTDSTNDMHIQPAIDHVGEGSFIELPASNVINVTAGDYDENLTVDKHVELYGAGSGPSAATNTILRKASTAAIVTLAASGASTSDPLLLQDLRIEPEGIYGINIPSGIVQYLELDNVMIVGAAGSTVENEVCLKVATAASLTDVVIADGAFDDCDYGWYFAKHGDWGPGGSTVERIEVTGTSFNNNSFKGIYAEKLSDTSFSSSEVIDNGDSDFWNMTWNGGVDINLKGEETYQNISFTDMTVTGNGLGYKEGAGFMIKARDDGSTYGAHPAMLNNVTITNSTISGNERGIRFGEPGKTNSGPTNITVTYNNITNNTQTYAGTDGSAYGGVINHSQSVVDATLNWWGDASGPSGDGPGTGDAVVEVNAAVLYCPWLDAPAPAGSPTSAGGGVATTSTDGHTTPYCTIEEAMFASVGANQEVHVSEGNWPNETMTRDYSDSPDLLVEATGSTAATIIDGMLLTGASFDGLTFDGFTFTDDHPGGFGDYHVTIDGDGSYKDLAFTDSVFDGQDVADIGAIFLNRGFEGFTLDGNTFQNYGNSQAYLSGGFITNYSLIFAEAQGADAGDGYVVTGNTFSGIKHLNSIEAYRWKNVDVNNNEISGLHGRILVWTSNSNADLESVSITQNTMDLSAGSSDYSTTGIGVYFVDATITIDDNSITDPTNGVVLIDTTSATLLGNTITAENNVGEGIYIDSSNQTTIGGAAVGEGNTVSGFETGIQVDGDVSDLVITGSTFSSNDTGMRVEGALNGLDVDASHFDNNIIGFSSTADVATGNNFTNIEITNSSFNNNVEKGIYVEKFDNALLDQIEVLESGGTGSAQRGAVDINLKYDDYSNITFSNSTVTNTTPQGRIAVAVKARDDAPNYDTEPATLDGLTIDNVTIKGSVTGVLLGSAGNATPTDAVVKNSEVEGARAISVFSLAGAEIDNNLVTVTIDDPAGYPYGYEAGVTVGSNGVTTLTKNIITNTTTSTDSNGVLVTPDAVGRGNAVIGVLSDTTQANDISGFIRGVHVFGDASIVGNLGSIESNTIGISVENSGIVEIRFNDLENNGTGVEFESGSTSTDFACNNLLGNTTDADNDNATPIIASFNYWEGVPPDTSGLFVTEPQLNDPATSPDCETTVNTNIALFDATGEDEQIRVSWATVSEEDLLGFNLYRSTDASTPGSSPLNGEMIPAQQAGTPNGASYEWLDTEVEPDVTYFYWLEVVAIDGTSMVGPVEASLSDPTAVTLRGLSSEGTTPLLPALMVGLAGLSLAGWMVHRRRETD